jgi:hypothetical protein
VSRSKYSGSISCLFRGTVSAQAYLTDHPLPGRLFFIHRGVAMSPVTGDGPCRTGLKAVCTRRLGRRERRFWGTVAAVAVKFTFFHERQGITLTPVGS